MALGWGALCGAGSGLSLGYLQKFRRWNFPRRKNANAALLHFSTPCSRNGRPFHTKEPIPILLYSQGNSIHRHLESQSIMAECEVCHNVYDKTFEVILGGNRHVFDSFECAIHALAPQCAHCGCRIIGHGLEANGKMFCHNTCARREGVNQLQDRA
jgi:hypothetical protein